MAMQAKSWGVFIQAGAFIWRNSGTGYMFFAFPFFLLITVEPLYKDHVNKSQNGSPRQVILSTGCRWHNGYQQWLQPWSDLNHLISDTLW